MAIPAYSEITFSVEGGERIRMVMEQYAKELIPMADEVIVKLVPKLQTIAVAKAQTMQVPPKAVLRIKARTFQRGGPMKPTFGTGGRTSIAIGFASATEVEGMMILRSVGREYEQSMWAYGEYPPGRRLWQEEFGLAGTRYPVAQVMAELRAAGQTIWAAPPYSAYRHKPIGVHWLYKKRTLRRDSRGRFVKGEQLVEGPGRPPKGFLRMSLREIGQKFTIEYSRMLKKLYEPRNKAAMAEGTTYGKKI